ncbi:hypothetical protein ACI797_04135 [Geodermatophilus sp. SYSU D00691]
MTISITEAPPGTIPHVALANRFSLDRRSLLLHLAPTNTAPGSIALTLLQSMGKQVRITGGNTVRTDEHRTYAPLWARAHGITQVALLDAQQARPATITAVLDLLPPGTDVVLVCEYGHEKATRTRLRRADLAVQTLDWETWHAGLPDGSDEYVGSAPNTPGYELDHLPLVDFLTFRYTSRDLNTPDRFAAIDADYVRVYYQALTVAPDEASVINHLDRSTVQATSTAPMLVAIRASQSAFFARGYFLQAHSDRLLGVLSCNRAPHATDADWRALRAYIRPERSATAALYLLGIPAKVLASTPVQAVADSLTSGEIAGRRIPALARPLLAVQLARRISEGAQGADSYLNLRGQRRHLEILIDARRHLGLPIDGRNLRNDHTNNSTRVLHRLGLEVRSLT